jgi:hypothetical protein
MDKELLLRLMGTGMWDSGKKAKKMDRGLSLMPVDLCTKVNSRMTNNMDRELLLGKMEQKE